MACRVLVSGSRLFHALALLNTARTHPLPSLSFPWIIRFTPTSRPVMPVTASTSMGLSAPPCHMWPCTRWARRELGPLVRTRTRVRMRWHLSHDRGRTCAGSLGVCNGAQKLRLDLRGRTFHCPQKQKPSRVGEEPCSCVRRCALKAACTRRPLGVYFPSCIMYILPPMRQHRNASRIARQRPRPVSGTGDGHRHAHLRVMGPSF